MDVAVLATMLHLASAALYVVLTPWFRLTMLFVR